MSLRIADLQNKMKQSSGPSDDAKSDVLPEVVGPVEVEQPKKFVFRPIRGD